MLFVFFSFWTHLVLNAVATFSVFCQVSKKSCQRIKLKQRLQVLKCWCWCSLCWCSLCWCCLCCTVYADADALYADAVYADAVYADAVYADAVYADAVYADTDAMLRCWCCLCWCWCSLCWCCCLNAIYVWNRRGVSESRQSSTEEVAHELFQNIEQFTKQVIASSHPDISSKWEWFRRIHDSISRWILNEFVLLMTCVLISAGTQIGANFNPPFHLFKLN